MADLVISDIDYKAADDSGLATSYPMVNIVVDDIYFTSCAADKLVLSLDNTVEYFEIATNGKTAYKYNPGDTFASSATSSAKDMYSKVYDAITRP
jgi:hypothetical protein